MSKLIRWVGTFFLTAFLIACGSGGGGAAQATKAKTTLLIYLVASDVIQLVEPELNNMLLAKSSDEVNVVLQIGGGISKGSFHNLDMTQTRRYRLVPTKPAAGATMTQGWMLEQLPEKQQPAAVAMNRAETLRDFIRWGVREFPAQKYALAMWDHGGGPIHGFGSDRSLGKNDPMLKTSDIASGLEQAGVHFELIGFNACLMASFEVASALSPYANYFVASEEVTTGWGWKDVVSYMVDNPLADGGKFGVAIVDAYKKFTEDHRQPGLDFSAYSVTDLRQVSALAEAIGKAAAHIEQKLDAAGLNEWLKVSAARREAEDFQSNIFLTNYDLVDVLSWVDELARRNMITPAMHEEIRAAHKAAVIYFDGGENRANGLMMYFPYYSILNQPLLAKYAELDFLPAIKGMLQSYARFASSAKMPIVTVNNPVLHGGAVTASVDSSILGLNNFFDKAYAALIQDGIAVSLQQVTSSGNELRINQPRVWPSVNGTLVSLLPDDEEGDLYTIPAAYISGGRSELGFLYALKNKAGELKIRWFVSARNLAGSGVAMLEVPAGAVFYAMGLDLEKNELTVIGTPLVAPEGDWLVQTATLQGDGYSVHMAVSDLMGQLKTSSVAVDLPTAP